MINTVLHIRAVCEAASREGDSPDRGLPDAERPAQHRLLCAAVQDIKDLDEVLHELRQTIP